MNLAPYAKFIAALCGAVLGVLQVPDLAHNWRLAAAGFVSAILVFFVPNVPASGKTVLPAPPVPQVPAVPAEEPPAPPKG